MSGKQITGIMIAFVFGLAFGKYSGKPESIRSMVFPVEGLRFDSVTLTSGTGVRDVRIATISHETPTGSIRYGRAESELGPDRIRIDGTMNGERIIMFGDVVSE